MNRYITGAMIEKLRESRGMTQAELAGTLCVSDKTVSKWENGRGYPDITLIEPLAKALGSSVTELISGNDIRSSSRSFNRKWVTFYVCPLCGNVIYSMGEAAVSCCGILLPALEAEEPDGSHALRVETVEDEYYVTVEHPMTKEHFLSFIAAVSDTGIGLVKLYPEGNAEARFKKNRVAAFLFYCNRDGLFAAKPPAQKRTPGK